MRFIIFFVALMSVYTQYLWPISTISPISPMQCFYGPVIIAHWTTVRL